MTCQASLWQQALQTVLCPGCLLEKTKTNHLHTHLSSCLLDPLESDRISNQLIVTVNRKKKNPRSAILYVCMCMCVCVCVCMNTCMHVCLTLRPIHYTSHWQSVSFFFLLFFQQRYLLAAERNLFLCGVVVYFLFQVFKGFDWIDRLWIKDKKLYILGFYSVSHSPWFCACVFFRLFDCLFVFITWLLSDVFLS